MNRAKRAGLICIVVALTVAPAATASADTYVVQPDGLGDYPTIQAAVDAAFDGDVIELTDGTFTGEGNRDIQVPSRPITICSQSESYLDCRIDCGGSAREEHRGFRFTSHVGTGDAILDGVGIINGYATDGGAGIWVEGANTIIMRTAVESCVVNNPYARGGGLRVSDGGSPSVAECVFSGNTAGMGGGVAVDNAAGTYSSCEIIDNTATDNGGGVYITADGTVTFGYCDIVSNEAPQGGGVRTAGPGTVYLQHCDISRNDATAGFAGGVLLQGGFVNLCTLVENSAVSGGGGIHAHAGTGGINQCIVAFSESGYGVGATDGYAPSLDCCDVYNNAAGEYDSVVGDQTGIEDNFSLDPQFCDRENADYTLYNTSPCLEANSPCGLRIGRYGQGCESPVEGASWGRVKALWR